jgi:DNA-binding CsgD family transcriptional regulator
MFTASADRMWERIGRPLLEFEILLDWSKRTRAECHEALGDESHTVAYRYGAGLTPAEMIAFAMDDQTMKPTAPEEGLSDSGATHLHRQRTPGPGWRLTKREQEVARLVFEGKSNREIADILVISPRTAEAHVEHILSKLGFVSRLQIARWVADHGHPRPKSACGDLEGRRTVALR